MNIEQGMMNIEVGAVLLKSEIGVGYSILGQTRAII
jgi:hypothetical protein